MSTTAETMYQLYLEAEMKVLAGQTVRFGDRQLTLANLPEIRNGRAEWARAVQNEKNKGRGYSLGQIV